MVFSYWFVLSYKNIKKIFTFWHTCLLFILKNACYSETKYYLCKQNNKRSLLGRKQRSRVARSFPNRYLFGLCDKVTSLFSTSCILDIILQCKRCSFEVLLTPFWNLIKHLIKTSFYNCLMTSDLRRWGNNSLLRYFSTSSSNILSIYFLTLQR